MEEQCLRLERRKIRAERRFSFTCCKVSNGSGDIIRSSQRGHFVTQWMRDRKGKCRANWWRMRSRTGQLQSRLPAPQAHRWWAAGFLASMDEIAPGSCSAASGHTNDFPKLFPFRPAEPNCVHRGSSAWLAQAWFSQAPAGLVPK